MSLLRPYMVKAWTAHGQGEHPFRTREQCNAWLAEVYDCDPPPYGEAVRWELWRRGKLLTHGSLVNGCEP